MSGRWRTAPLKSSTGIYDDEGTSVAKVTRPADARLMASAPELLAAVAACRSELWRLLDAKGVQPIDARNWPEIVAADRAIYKATGATP